MRLSTRYNQLLRGLSSPATNWSHRIESNSLERHFSCFLVEYSDFSVVAVTDCLPPIKEECGLILVHLFGRVLLIYSIFADHWLVPGPLLKDLYLNSDTV